MRLRSGFVSVALVALSASASTTTDIAHAPERAVSAPQFTAAAGNQLGSIIATNGDLSLAVWSDWRGERNDIYATRLDHDGHPLDPLGIVVSSGSASAVVWNGSEFAVFIRRLDGIDAVAFVGTDGRVSRPKALPKGIGQFSAASDHGAARILFFTPPATVTVLDGHGDLVAPAFKLPSPVELYNTADLVGVGDSEFIVFRSGSGLRTPLAQRISFDGRLISSSESNLPFRPDTRSAIAGRDGEYAIVRESGNVVLYRLTADGVWDGAEETLQAQTTDLFCCLPPAMTREGDRYVIAWRTTLPNGHASTYAATVPIHGAGAHTRQLAEFAGFAWDVALASNSGRTEIISAVGRDTTSTAFDLFGQNATASLDTTPPEVIALSATVQTGVATASGNNGFLIAWAELGPDGFVHLLAVRVTPNGASQDAGPTEIARVPIEVYNRLTPRPRVVSNGETYLVSWAAGTIQGRRLAAGTGQWIDPAPFTIGTGDALALASNGSDALAVWRGGCPAGDRACLYARPVSFLGDPLSSAAVTVASKGDHFEPALASDGSDYLLAWSNGSRLRLNPAPALDPFRLLAARLRPDGTRIDAEVIVVEDRKSYAVEPSVAWSGDRYVVVWSTRDALHAARITREGAVPETGTIVQQEAASDVLRPLLVSRRGELILLTRHVSRSNSFHVAWEAASIASSSDLSELRSSPRTIIMENDGDTWYATLDAISGPSLLLAYDRRVTEGIGGVPRAFFRLLPALERRRAARH